MNIAPVRFSSLTKIGPENIQMCIDKKIPLQLPDGTQFLPESVTTDPTPAVIYSIKGKGGDKTVWAAAYKGGHHIWFLGKGPNPYNICIKA